MVGGGVRMLLWVEYSKTCLWSPALKNYFWSDSYWYKKIGMDETIMWQDRW